MELWGANHPNYSVINTPTMLFITSFGMVCTLHFYSVAIVITETPTVHSRIPQVAMQGMRDLSGIS